MERGEELSLDDKKVTDRGPKLENRSLVTDNGVREAMVLQHHIDNHFRKSWNINGDLD